MLGEVTEAQQLHSTCTAFSILIATGNLEYGFSIMC